MITIRMSQRWDGMDIAEADWNGQTFRAASRNGATMALARVLCEAGAPDSPWVGVDSLTGTERLYGPSTHRLAALTVKEGGNGRPRFAKWEPHPRAEA